jgi:hypothetical protein
MRVKSLAMRGTNPSRKPVAALMAYARLNFPSSGVPQVVLVVSLAAAIRAKVFKGLGGIETSRLNIICLFL